MGYAHTRRAGRDQERSVDVRLRIADDLDSPQGPGVADHGLDLPEATERRALPSARLPSELTIETPNGPLTPLSGLPEQHLIFEPYSPI